MFNKFNTVIFLFFYPVAKTCRISKSGSRYVRVEGWGWGRLMAMVRWMTHDNL